MEKENVVALSGPFDVLSSGTNLHDVFIEAASQIAALQKIAGKKYWRMLPSIETNYDLDRQELQFLIRARCFVNTKEDCNGEINPLRHPSAV